MNKIDKIKYSVPSPCYIVDEGALIRNLEILKGVRERTGAKILLAQKAFSCYHLYPLIAQYLDGTACSGLFEARLGYEEMGMESPTADISSSTRSRSSIPIERESSQQERRSDCA